MASSAVLRALGAPANCVVSAQAVDVIEAGKQAASARVGGGDEWHVVFCKCLAQNDIGKKASLGSMVSWEQPINRKEAKRCAILARGGFGNRSDS